MSEEPTCTGCNASGKQPCSVGQGRGSWYDPPQTANGIAQLVTWAYGGRHGSDMPHHIGDREVGTAHTTDCTSELSKGWYWPVLRTAVAGFLGSSSAATCGSIRLIGRLGRVLCPLTCCQRFADRCHLGRDLIAARLRNARYKRSAKRKAANARYKRSAKGKAANARYRHSPKGKATQARLERSARAKIRHAVPEHDTEQSKAEAFDAPRP
jgi:hypothetical protein